MHEKVESFLRNCEAEQQRKDDLYYYLVMSYANLLSDEKDFVEVSKSEYDNYLTSYDGNDKKVENKHYYVKKRIPIDISEEEFSMIESAIPQDKLDDIKLQSTGIDLEKEKDGSSRAATFFTVLAWLLWIGGLFIAISGATITTEYGTYYTYHRTEFSFSLFMSVFVIYLVSGCFALCAAELFKKLQTIVNLLKRIQ